MSKLLTVQPFDPRLRYPIPTAARFLGISRASLYKHIGAGDIRVLREGKRVFVPGSEIARRSQLPEQRVA